MDRAEINSNNFIGEILKLVDNFAILSVWEGPI